MDAVYELPAYPELSACLGFPVCPITTTEVCNELSVCPVTTTEVVPLSEVLPLMEVAILCVWAKHTTTVSPKVVTSTSELSVTPTMTTEIIPLSATLGVGSHNLVCAGGIHLPRELRLSQAPTQPHAPTSSSVPFIILRPDAAPSCQSLPGRRIPGLCLKPPRPRLRLDPLTNRLHLWLHLGQSSTCPRPAFRIPACSLAA